MHENVICSIFIPITSTYIPKWSSSNNYSTQYGGYDIINSTPTGLCNALKLTLVSFSGNFAMSSSFTKHSIMWVMLFVSWNSSLLGLMLEIFLTCEKGLTSLVWVWLLCVCNGFESLKNDSSFISCVYQSVITRPSPSSYT